MSITISGASDDLIEIEGDIREEFYLRDEDEGDLIAFSDGTVLRIAFSGPWRITPVAKGSAELSIQQVTEDDDEGSDRATITGDVRWVVHGIGILLASGGTA
jgi:hypothetical protein